MSHSAARAHGIHQVQGRVGRGPIRTALAAHDHDRHGAVLHHEAENGPGVGHRIGAVADDDAVHSPGDFVADGDGQGLVLLRPHVLAEDAEELLRGEVGNVGQFGHGAVEFAGREGGDHRAGAVIEPRGDGPARAQQRDLLLLGIEGEILLGNFVDGLFVAGLLDRNDPLRGDADVVAVEQFDHQVEIIERFAAGQNDADEGRAAVVGDLDLAPDAHLVLLQQFLDGASIALKAVGALAEGEIYFCCCSSSYLLQLRLDECRHFRGGRLALEHPDGLPHQESRAPFVRVPFRAAIALERQPIGLLETRPRVAASLCPGRHRRPRRSGRLGPCSRPRRGWPRAGMRPSVKRSKTWIHSGIPNRPTGMPRRWRALNCWPIDDAGQQAVHAGLLDDRVDDLGAAAADQVMGRFLRHAPRHVPVDALPRRRPQAGSGLCHPLLGDAGRRRIRVGIHAVGAGQNALEGGDTRPPNPAASPWARPPWRRRSAGGFRWRRCGSPPRGRRR